MIWTVPNILTLARIAAAPCVALVFVVFERPLADWLAFGLFVGAALTDFLDGWLARRWGQTSEIGKMLDPIADKAMVIIALMVLLWMSKDPHWIAVPAVLIVLREVLVSGLREYLGDVKLAVTKLAKWKTAAQMISMGALMFAMPSSVPGHAPTYDQELVLWLATGAAETVGLFVLWLSALLTVISGGDYFRKGLAHIRAREAR